MNQTFHILKKDLWHLKWEAAAMFAISLLSAWSESSRLRNPRISEAQPEGWALLVMGLAVVVLITRVIHSEAIPGDRQFWLTRPYRWSSLLVAKLLFILLCVNVPILLAQTIIVAAVKFPIVPNVSALLWSQVLLSGAVFVPIALVAAVTPGAASFFSAIVGFIVVNLLLGKVLGVGRPHWDLAQMAWIGLTGIPLFFLIGGAVVLVTQYRSRRTLASSMLAVATYAAPVLVLGLIGPSAMAVEAMLSPKPEAAAGIYVSEDFGLNRVPNAPSLPRSNAVGDYVRIRLPLVVKGVPEGDEARIDALVFMFEASDGHKWNFPPTLNTPPMEASALQSDVFIDAPFFDSERSKPVTFRATLYLTLFGKESERILASPIINITPRLQCGEYDQTFTENFLLCRTAFRSPGSLVVVKRGADTYRVWQQISYSPFPAELTLNPISDIRFVSSEEGTPSLVMREPLAHFRRDVEIRDLRLADFVPK